MSRRNRRAVRFASVMETLDDRYPVSTLAFSVPSISAVWARAGAEFQTDGSSRATTSMDSIRPTTRESKDMAFSTLDKNASHPKTGRAIAPSENPASAWTAESPSGNPASTTAGVDAPESDLIKDNG